MCPTRSQIDISFLIGRHLPSVDLDSSATLLRSTTFDLQNFFKCPTLPHFELFSPTDLVTYTYYSTQIFNHSFFLSLCLSIDLPCDGAKAQDFTGASGNTNPIRVSAMAQIRSRNSTIWTHVQDSASNYYSEPCGVITILNPVDKSHKRKIILKIFGGWVSNQLV